MSATAYVTPEQTAVLVVAAEQGPAGRDGVVLSVNGQSAAHVVLTKADVGLSAADNTPDAAKPVSGPQQIALNDKASLLSPAFTGQPTAPMADLAAASDQLATLRWVQARLAQLIGAAPASLDTIYEIAAAVQNDESAIAAINTAIAGKLSKASNLADLVDVGAARGNLGLGAVALLTAINAANIADASANGRALLTAADYAAMRTLLGLVPGSDVQAHDVDLDAIAALGTNAFGRALLTLADAPGLRAAAGLNTAGAVAFRNRLRNGAFSINQRAVTGTVTLAAGAYGHDGWKAGASGCTYTFATAESGDTTITITAGTLLQVVEGTHLLREGGAYALSWTGTATGRIYQGAASGAYAASPVTASNLTAGTNATVEFGTGTLGLVQLEPGSSPTAYERRDDELIRCQRYLRPFAVRRTFYASQAGQVDRFSETLQPPMRATPSLAATLNAAQGNCGYTFGDFNAAYIRFDTTVTAAGYADVYALFLLSAEL